MISYVDGYPTAGIKAMGPIRLRGFWLDAHQHIVSDRRQARRLARRSGVRFTVCRGWGRRYYLFDARRTQP